MMTVNKYTLFISDTHLCAQEPLVSANLLAFFKSELLARADALYILGDFFMLWAGDDDNATFIKPIKEALIAQTQTGKRIFLLPGNRDFLIGKNFAVATGITLLTDPTIIELYGEKTLLTHGDILCSKEALHRNFRALSQNETVKKLFAHLPLFLRKAIAYALHFYSERRYKKPPSFMDQMAQEITCQMLKNYNVTQIIHGHLHQQRVIEFNQEELKMRRINLGNWQNQQKSILIYHQNSTIEFIN